MKHLYCPSPVRNREAAENLNQGNPFKQHSQNAFRFIEVQQLCREIFQSWFGDQKRENLENNLLFFSALSIVTPALD